MSKIDFIKSVSSPLHFIGTYNPNMEYEYGAICIRNDILYIHDGRNNWTELGTNCSEPIYESPTLKFITNCPNCGAPMQNHRCMYCGTEDYGS